MPEGKLPENWEVNSPGRIRRPRWLTYKKRQKGTGEENVKLDSENWSPDGAMGHPSLPPKKGKSGDPAFTRIIWLLIIKKQFLPRKPSTSFTKLDQRPLSSIQFGLWSWDRKKGLVTTTCFAFSSDPISCPSLLAYFIYQLKEDFLFFSALFLSQTFYNF